MWRPKFSVRTLVIFVTLVAAYFGAWDVTKRYGHGVSPMPFVIYQDVVRARSAAVAGPAYPPQRRYYLWFFGAKVKVYQPEIY